MRVKGLELLFLEVNSLEESLDFYRGALGFELTEHAPEGEPPMATLRAGSLRLMLAQVPLAMARRGRGVHFFLTVEDVDEFYDFARAGGAHVEPPADEGWGGRFVTLEDPDRYRLFFVAWYDEDSQAGPAPGLWN
ncbi:MAG TPA: VOC family protein [Pyrinomonadaceae bacterium]|jgi:catechol 2,3-dioxygenase-like lactoylglutathione lyase family enzyme